MPAVLEQDYLPSPRRILNHDVSSCSAGGLLGSHLHSGRALGISEPWDQIQLHPDLQPLWDEIQAHYERIGLSHSKHVIWHLVRESLGGHIGFHPSVFYYGPQECRCWGDDLWLEAAEFSDSKNNFIALAEELGVPTPRTRCYDDVSEVDPDRIPDADFPCYLKAAVSGAGAGIHRCADRMQLEQALGHFAPGTSVQVQEEVVSDHFLNLQYEVEGDELLRLEVSEQILEGFAHRGNQVPACFLPWRSVEPMAVWLKDRGLKGVFAFDVAVVRSEAGITFQALECNPRYNGASYPTLIARKLGIREWAASTFETRHRTLEAIDLRGLEFDPATRQGVVLVNWGTVLEGQLMVLIAGPKEAREALQVKLQAALS